VTGLPRCIEAFRARLPRADPKNLVTFLITLILVLGEWRYSILGGYDRLAAALGACLVTEALLSRVMSGAVARMGSAYISGISLALLTKPQPGLLWPFILGGFLAITSKYVLTYRGRHLWNPSNFAIGVLLLAVPGSVAILSHQWGNELGTNAVIWAFGLLIAFRARVLHVTMAYVLSFMALAVVRHLIVGGPLAAEVAPITGPMYQLFIFFMITDPRTTVSTVRGRVIVAVLVAVVEMLIRLAGDFQLSFFSPLFPSPPILALFIVGPVAMAIDLHGKAVREAEAEAGLRRATVAP
jgi:enediyne biosynthesis protein E5